MMPTALIVEDEPAANNLLAMLVQLRGYQTDSAYTGTEALEKIGRKSPDIVFLDLMLPDINGYEVCQSLKARETTRMAIVVVVTARVAAENRLQSFSAGADDYIPKPYTPDQIFQALADAEAWRHLVECREAEGSIALDRGDVDESFRQLARLRSLLPVLTPLDGDAVARLGAFLKELWISADTWGSAHNILRVADLAYRLDARGVSLEVRDGSGWLASSPMTREPALRGAIESARFGRVSHDGAGLRVALFKDASAPQRPDSGTAGGHRTP